MFWTITWTLLHAKQSALSFAALELSRGIVPFPHFHLSLTLSSSQQNEGAEQSCWASAMRGLLIKEEAVLRKCPVPWRSKKEQRSKELCDKQHPQRYSNSIQPVNLVIYKQRISVNSVDSLSRIFPNILPHLHLAS